MAQYWLDLFTPKTWEEAHRRNFEISGFREKRWSITQKIKPGDLLICYITEISRFAGILMVISKPYKDEKKAKEIWKEAFFPCLMNVKPVITLDFLHSIPAKEIIPKLTIAKKWGGIRRGSPNRINKEDGDKIREILQESKKENREYPLAEQVIKYTSTKPRKLKKQEYGLPIDFRGLRHGPINEQGVVYLFALVAKDLGFHVEAIGTTFPDCEAIRCIDKRKERWQRVHIEFEFLSSNYDHPSEGCDILVCWKHNWKECPLEVIELSEVIKKLGA